VRLVAIVAQRADAVRRYIEEVGLPFEILIDETRSVAKAYGVWHAWGLDAYNIARPAVFLIDRTGVIHYSFIASRQSQYPSPKEVMGAIEELLSGDR